MACSCVVAPYEIHSEMLEGNEINFIKSDNMNEKELAHAIYNVVFTWTKKELSETKDKYLLNRIILNNGFISYIETLEGKLNESKRVKKIIKWCSG